MTEQNEALRLADVLERPDDSLRWADGNNLIPQAAAELRRLSDINAQLLEALEGLESWATDVRRDDPAADLAKARAAIAAAKESA